MLASLGLRSAVRGKSRRCGLVARARKHPPHQQGGERLGGGEEAVGLDYPLRVWRYELRSSSVLAAGESPSAQHHRKPPG